MAYRDLDVFLGATILLLAFGGLCLLLAVRLLRAPARKRAARSEAPAPPRRAGAVERMNMEIATVSGAEWNADLREMAARAARPKVDLKAMHDDAIDAARERVLALATSGAIPHTGPGRALTTAEMASYWSSEAIQAIKADQDAASSDAHWKAEYYKHLARQQQKAAAAVRRKQRQVEQQAAERRKKQRS